MSTSTYISTILSARIQFYAILSALLLCLPAFAGKGGNGKGNGGGGGEEPSGPVEVEAPVTYRVTWFDPEEALGLSGPPTSVQFTDVNSRGEAVGFVRQSDGTYIAVLATVSNDGTDTGTLLDLNDVFADALAEIGSPDYPEYSAWRFSLARQINSAGQIAGRLVPEMYADVVSSPVKKIVVADLDTLAIHDLGTFYAGNYTPPPKMNKWGDVVMTQQLAEESDRSNTLYLHQTDQSGQSLSYTEIPLDKVDALQTPEQNVWIGGMNGSLTMAFSAWSPETNSSDPFIYHFDPDPDSDAAPENLPTGQKRKDDVVWGIAEDGTIYAGITAGRFAEPMRWRGKSTGWEPFMELRSVSRDEIDPSVLSHPTSLPRPPLVHQDSLQGFFSVTVTEGDVERFNRELDESPILNGAALGTMAISSRTNVSDVTASKDHGFICGHDGGDMDTGGAPSGFILTPLAP